MVTSKRSGGFYPSLIGDCPVILFKIDIIRLISDAVARRVIMREGIVIKNRACRRHRRVCYNYTYEQLLIDLITR